MYVLHYQRQVTALHLEAHERESELLCGRERLRGVIGEVTNPASHD